jgi:hypothetical protein
MKLLLPLLAILFLFVTSPLEANILVLDGTLMPKEGFTEVPEEVFTRESSSAYQSDVFRRLGGVATRLKHWLPSEEAATIGPLAIGLFLLILPLPFSRSRANARAARARAEDSNLRRIGQSWDPRF